MKPGCYSERSGKDIDENGTIRLVFMNDVSLSVTLVEAIVSNRTMFKDDTYDVDYVDGLLCPVSIIPNSEYDGIKWNIVQR